MSPMTTVVAPTPPLFDETRLAVAGFLARYSGPTRKSYATDLRQYFAWCARVGLEVFATKRPHIELWARDMEDRGLARATIGRRLSTIAGFYRFAVIDGTIEHSPAEHVRRPKIDTESATLGLDRMELRLHRPGRSGRRHGPRPGLPARPARPSGVGGSQHRHRAPGPQTWPPHRHGSGQGSKLAVIPLPPKVGRAVDLAAGRTFERSVAPRCLRRPSQSSGGSTNRAASSRRPASPNPSPQLHHRRALDAGVPLRDVQIAARHRRSPHDHAATTGLAIILTVTPTTYHRLHRRRFVGRSDSGAAVNDLLPALRPPLGTGERDTRHVLLRTRSSSTGCPPASSRCSTHT